MQEYKITIALNERSALNPHDSQSRLTNQSDNVETVTRVQVKQRSNPSAIVTAYLHHVQGPAGFHSLNPVISVGRILPDDSAIFTIVSCGDVNQLKRLLMERQCTLRDRDSGGTPLLHVRKSLSFQAALYHLITTSTLCISPKCASSLLRTARMLMI